jgi:hypothetical protein
MLTDKLTWRAVGQAVLIYLVISGSAVTAQITQPGRATFAKMVANAAAAAGPGGTGSMEKAAAAGFTIGFYATSFRTNWGVWDDKVGGVSLDHLLGSQQERL